MRDYEEEERGIEEELKTWSEVTCTECGSRFNIEYNSKCPNCAADFMAYED